MKLTWSMRESKGVYSYKNGQTNSEKIERSKMQIRLMNNLKRMNWEKGNNQARWNWVFFRRDWRIKWRIMICWFRNCNITRISLKNTRIIWRRWHKGIQISIKCILNWNRVIKIWKLGFKVQSQLSRQRK